eukprot:TRINITY_DN50749_c0_g1_i1.p1 TRINITY_DN50749_c0_g1~~TRINITY_DN50749_c0_g1_i1.p1  ORF type:complete len:106 (+),score=19.64 TRINITY_DN50749_c0_g1_i1:389-706(+)
MTRMLSSTAHKETELAELLNERVSQVAKGIEGWLQGTQSRDVTCCVHVVFPRGIYGTNSTLPLDTNSPALLPLSLIHISEPTRLLSISYAVFCLKKKKRVKITNT